MENNTLFHEYNKGWKITILVFAIIFTLGIVSNFGIMLEPLYEGNKIKYYDAILVLLCSAMATVFWIMYCTSKKLKATFTITQTEIFLNKEQQINGTNRFKTIDFKNHEVVKSKGKITFVRLFFVNNKTFQIGTRKYSQLKLALDYLELRNRQNKKENPQN